jgi:hypothetical protein
MWPQTTTSPWLPKHSWKTSSRGLDGRGDVQDPEAVVVPWKARSRQKARSLLAVKGSIVLPLGEKPTRCMFLLVSSSRSSGMWSADAGGERARSAAVVATSARIRGRRLMPTSLRYRAHGGLVSLGWGAR